MKKLWRNRPILIALLAAALFLMLAALTVGRRTASRAEDLFSNAILPIQEAVSDVTDRVTDFFTRVFFPSSIQEENKRLTDLVSAYERRLILYEAMEQENARLSELLDYASSNSNFYFMTAPVSAKNLDPYVDTLTVRGGSRSGVTEPRTQTLRGPELEDTGWLRSAMARRKEAREASEREKLRSAKQEKRARERLAHSPDLPESGFASWYETNSDRRQIIR